MLRYAGHCFSAGACRLFAGKESAVVPRLGSSREQQQELIILLTTQNVSS